MRGRSSTCFVTPALSKSGPAGLTELESLDVLLDDVTFVVTVRERCKHLRRVLDYYSRFPVRVVVMDSSDRKCSIDRHPGKYRHIHLPQTFVFEAISKTLAEVETPYCVLVPDDDFVIPYGAAESVRFLGQNPDYQCAQGVYGRFKNVGNVQLREAYPHMPGYAVVSDLPQDRMIEHLGHYVTQYSAVHRTERLRAAVCVGLSVKNFSANEVVMSGAIAMEGKLKVLPVLYCIREIILTSQSALLQQGERNVKIVEALSDHQEHRALIRNCNDALGKALEARGVAAADATAAVRNALEAYRLFVADNKARVEQWQAGMYRDAVPTFAEVLSQPDGQRDWNLIKEVVEQHDLSPIVPPLLVDDDGRTIRKWSNSPLLFGIAKTVRNLLGVIGVSRIVFGIRSLLRKGAVR